MSEPADDDQQKTSWLLTDRVDYLEQVVTHLLETRKDMLEYFSVVLAAIKEIPDDDSEE